MSAPLTEGLALLRRSIAFRDEALDAVLDQGDIVELLKSRSDVLLQYVQQLGHGELLGA